MIFVNFCECVWGSESRYVDNRSFKLSETESVGSVTENIFVKTRAESIFSMNFVEFVFLLTSFAFFSQVESARILGIFPYPSKSHVILGQPIFVELAKRGHEVVFISPFPLKNPPKGYKDIVLTEKGLFEVYEEEMKAVFEMIEQNPITMFSEMFNNTAKTTEFTIIDKAVQELLNSKTEKFDLVFIDTLMNEALLGLCIKME